MTDPLSEISCPDGQSSIEAPWFGSVVQAIRDPEQGLSRDDLLEERPSIISEHHQPTEWALDVQDRFQKMKLGRW